MAQHVATALQHSTAIHFFRTKRGHIRQPDQHGDAHSGNSIAQYIAENSILQHSAAWLSMAGHSKGHNDVAGHRLD